MINDTERTLQEIRAEKLARTVFTGKLDRSGHPVILHTERVAKSGKTAEERTVGWLHDIVEDTDITLDDLRKMGFDEEIVETVDQVSRRPGETYKEFIERIAEHPPAVLVKLHDLRDNRKRCEQLGGDEGAGLARRYDRALERLAPLEQSIRERQTSGRAGGR